MWGGFQEAPGNRLRVAGEDAANGIYFVPAAKERARIRVDDALVTRNQPKTLEFFVPDSLIAGEPYYLEIVSQYGSGTGLLKRPRVFRSERPLVVE
jgi:hypothetical protein